MAVPASRIYKCGTCSAPAIKTMEYTPDFEFGAERGDRRVYVEAKGRFDASHRIKAKAFNEQYPFTYAMCFEEDNKLSKTSKTRYSDWCTKAGIPYKIGLITPAWLESLL